MGYEKIVVVTRRTRLEELAARFGTRGQAKFYLESSGLDFGDYQREDDAYRRSLEEVRRGLELGLKVQSVDRGLVPTLLVGPQELFVAVGQDGLVANCAKYVGEQPLLGVNPDPERFDGVLLPFRPAEAGPAARRVLEGRAKERRASLAEAELRDGQKLRAFNDFFLGARTHVSARYRLEAGGRSEKQSSSGVIVATGAGSTGWLSSVFNMASGVTAFAGGKPGPGLRWDAGERRLAYVVREPFKSRHSGAELVAGTIEDGQRLVVESMMPTAGVIFSDGVEQDFLDFNAGAVARVGVAERQARLIVG